MKIVQKNDKILREIAHEVPIKDIGGKRMKGILKKMDEALASKKEGVAIAAPQIGEPLRMFIVDGNVWELKEKIIEQKKMLPKKPSVVFINPVIKKMSQKKQDVYEGCLSVDKIYGNLKRAEKVVVEALDEKGKKFTLGASGLIAQIVQHEVDHLNGILFIDKTDKLEKISNI
jgi:peptide deformylase